MNGSYARFILSRIFWVTVIAVGFCALPGPRSVLDNLGDYLFSPHSLNSLWAGMHLSLVHFCWLFGFDLQLLPYPAGVDKQLAAISFLASVVLQAIIILLACLLLRGSLTHYDDDGEEFEEE